jgi:hypothetical protein
MLEGFGNKQVRTRFPAVQGLTLGLSLSGVVSLAHNSVVRHLCVYKAALPGECTRIFSVDSWSWWNTWVSRALHTFEHPRPMHVVLPQCSCVRCGLVTYLAAPSLFGLRNVRSMDWFHVAAPLPRRFGGLLIAGASFVLQSSAAISSIICRSIYALWASVCHKLYKSHGELLSS